MPAVIDLPNYTVTVFGPDEDPYARRTFSNAERDSLESALKARGFTLRKAYTETLPSGEVLFHATRDSDGKHIVIQVDKK